MNFLIYEEILMFFCQCREKDMARKSSGVGHGYEIGKFEKDMFLRMKA